jgi:hypothetical protein
MKNINFTFAAIVLFMPYIGQGSIAYGVAIAFILFNITSLAKLNKNFLLFCFLILSVYTAKSLFPNAYVLLRYWQVYFGFLIFYLFFYLNNTTISIEKISLLLSVMVIAEAILINTVIPATAMLNIPSSDGGLLDGHYTNYFGFYQRPYGSCANPSMTSTLLVVLYTLALQKNTKWLIISAVFLSGSTTGYMLLVIAYFIKNPLSIRTILYFALIIFLAIIFSRADEYFAYRISPIYLLTIVEYTIEQFFALLKPDDYSLLIGINYLVDGEPIFQTDNGWAPFFFTNGLLICAAYLLTPFWKGSFPQKAPYLIFLIGAIHYPAIFSLPGQVIFALLLSNRIATDQTSRMLSKTSSQMSPV